MNSSSEAEPEDSFATPNPVRRDLPGYKQPKPLSTHTNQLNGWIMTEKPTAGPTPPTTGRSKLNQLHFSPQKGFRSSRKSGGGGGGSGGGSGAKGTTATTEKDPNTGAWRLGRTEYTIQRNSPSFQRGKAKGKDAGELKIRSNITPNTATTTTMNTNVNTNMNMTTTPVGMTRQPITPPDEAELDGMFSLRRDKGKGKATLSQMNRADRDLGAVIGLAEDEDEGVGEQEGRFGGRDGYAVGGGGGGGGFPENVADSQDEGAADRNGHGDMEEEEEEDIFRPKRSRRNPIPTSDLPTPFPVPAMDEMQESIMFLGHRNATPSASTSTSKARPTKRPSLGSASGSASRPARTSQGPTVQTKLSEFLKPRELPVGSVRPRPKRAAGKKKEVDAEVEMEEPVAEAGIEAVIDEVAKASSSNSKKKKTGRRSTIMEDRQGVRRVTLNVETQDIVPDSQTLDSDLWNRLPLDMNVEPDMAMNPIGEADPPRDPRSDTGEDLDHPIEVFDESMVPQARPAVLELRVPEPTARTSTPQDPSSDSSLRGESDDEMHSLAYRDQVEASKRQINRTSGTAQDDESYRPVGFVGVPMRGRRVPIGAGLRAKSGLRAMVMHEDDDGDEDEERSGTSAKKQRALRSTRSKSRAKSTELRRASGSRQVDEEDPDTDTEQPVQRGEAGGSDLADAARAATEKVRLSRTTSGGSSHTSVTQGLDASSDLTPLPSEYEQEGPDVLEVELPEELRLSPDHHEIRAVADDDEEVTPRRSTRRMVRIESHEEHAPRDATEDDLDAGEIGEVTVIPETARMSEIYPTVDDLEMAFGSAPRNADETMPATFDMEVDDDVFAEDIPADVGVSTIPQSWAHEMQPSLLGWARISIGDRSEIVAPAGHAVSGSSGVPREARATTPIPFEEPSAALQTPPRQPSVRSQREPTTPSTPHRPVSKAVQALRTPHREPLRDIGFTVPILGQPRTPIGPSSTRKFINRSPQSPVTPSKITPARASLQSPRSAVRSPAARHEEWVDNAETLATWSPAKYESFYSLQPPLAGGTSLRQAFEETLRKEPAVMPLIRPSSSPQKSASDDPVLGNEPSSDSAPRSDDAEAKNSLRSEASAGHKRKLAGSEDGTIPGTFQNSGPSFHLLQSAPDPGPSKKRAKLSEQDGHVKTKSRLVDPEMTPKPAGRASQVVGRTPVLDPQNPMAAAEDTTPRSKKKHTSPKLFESVANAWWGVEQDQEDDPSGAPQGSAKPSKTKKHSDGKEQTSLQAFGYSRQRKKKEPGRTLLRYDCDFEDEEDIDLDMAEKDEPGRLVDEGAVVAAAEHEGRLSHVPRPPVDPRLRGQGRRLAQEKLDKEEAEERERRRAVPLSSEPRPGIEPLQAEPRSHPLEARIYSMEDLEAMEGEPEVVPSSQYGENLSPLRSLSSSGRRSLDDGSSFRTMEPPGEETQMWWKAMNDMTRD